MIHPCPAARPLRLVLAWACLFLSGPWLTGAEATRSSFSISGGDAALTLRQLSRQARESVVFPIDLVHGVQTHPVQGEFTAREAAERMTAGTELFVSQDSQTGALLIARRAKSETTAMQSASSFPASSAPMKPKSALGALRAWMGLALAAVSAAPAAATPSGTISGRILRTDTGEYVRNAEVSLRGTTLATVSEDDGAYRLAGVPVGEATIVVNYTGAAPVSATVIVRAGEETRRDLELISTLAGPAGVGRDSVVRLEAFTVSGEREGNAKAIMEQRQSMNITNTVASDTFGDMGEGNIGDFLRNLPGIDLELTQGEVRNVRLRGLGSEYNAVTLDGVSLASSDANRGAAGDARGFSFEQVSLGSMDSIEVSKTISADVDANAPAGTINLKTRHAFSLSGRRITAQGNLTAFADEWHFRRTYGPDDARHYKINPGGSFEYSDVFFNKRLGLVFNLSESQLYSENARSVVTYNYTPTAADPRPVVPTSVAFLHAPRLNRRSTVSLKADFKATDHLALSLLLMYNYASLYNVQRTTTFNAGTRAGIMTAGADPLTSFVSATNGTVTVNPNVVVKPGQTATVVPRFEYKRGPLTLEGRFVGSESISWYNPLARKGSVNNAGSPSLPGIQFRAERSSLLSSDWKITQLGGPDFSRGEGYSAGVFNANDGRYGRTRILSGDLQATYRTSRFLPVVWKAGVKRKHEARDFLLDTESKRYTYTGPGAGTGAWAGIPSPNRFDPDSLHARITSLSGGTVVYPNLLAMGKLFQERPDYFTHSLSATNYYNAFIGNVRHYEEDITAGFLMGTASLGRALVRAGLRYEDTATDALEWNPRTAAEVRAAGFAETNGRATTIPGLQYQFFSQPRIHREGGYDNWFPSGSLKYRFTRNLDLHLGYSATIRRPTIRDLAGVWVVNDDNFTVNAPNPRLQPETSDNYAVRLAYYFEPVGLLALNVFQNTVQGLHRSTRMTAAEFGYRGEEDLSAYEFITTTASEEEVRIRGLEFEYNQSLSFLPRPFRGLNVRASYTRSYSSVVTPSMSPHGANAGLNYT